MAECTEYTALTQNILTFMGFNSYYVTGHFSTGSTEEDHAFNLVQTSKEKFFLIDSSNPIVIFNEKGNIIAVRTRSCVISEEQFKNSISGEDLEIELNACNFQRINDTMQSIDKDIWKYEIKKIYTKKDENTNHY